MQTVWIWMRRRIIHCLIRIQSVWCSDNLFTKFERHWRTLNNEADETYSKRQFISRAKGKVIMMVIFFTFLSSHIIELGIKNSTYNYFVYTILNPAWAIIYVYSRLSIFRTRITRILQNSKLLSESKIHFDRFLQL